METSAQGVTLIAFIGLALGLTYMASQVRILPYAFSASIAWLVPLIALATGTLGPGITETWVQAICLLLVLMAFAPLLLQMRQEVQHERRFGDAGSFNWKSYEKRGWTPEDKDSYARFRGNLKEITTRANQTRSSAAKAQRRYAEKIRNETQEF